MHEERLPECERFQCDIAEQIKEHLRESVPVRADVEKSKNQIITLEKAHEAVMQDIQDIKKDVGCIKTDIKDLNASVKIWVLSGICGTIMAFAIPTMMLFYNAGRMQMQLDVNTDRWNRILPNVQVK